MSTAATTWSWIRPLSGVPSLGTRYCMWVETGGTQGSALPLNPPTTHQCCRPRSVPARSAGNERSSRRHQSQHCSTCSWHNGVSLSFLQEGHGPVGRREGWKRGAVSADLVSHDGWLVQCWLSVHQQYVAIYQMPRDLQADMHRQICTVT